MSLQHKELILQPQITTSNVKLSKIYHLWDDLTQYSVEAIAANRASIYDFIEHDCMYFAAVQRRVRVRLPEAEKTSKLQTKSDSAFDDADDLAYESDCSHTSNFAGLVPAKDADKPKNTRIIPIGTGLVYLTPSHFPGTVNLGVMIDPHARRNGYGSRVVRMVLSWAFDELRSHRVIVQVIGGDNSRRNIAARLFNSLGFTNEGISRRAIFCPAPPPKPDDPSAIRGDGQWQDVTTFSILDTDWMIRRNWTALPESFIKTKWEAMFMRHEIERDQLVAIEEEAEKRRVKVKRSTTMDSATVVDIEYMELTDDEKKQCSELLGEEFREEPIFDDDDLQNDSFNNDLSTPSMSMFQNPYSINYPYPTFPLDSLDNSSFRAGFYPTPFHLPAESSTSNMTLGQFGYSTSFAARTSQNEDTDFEPEMDSDSEEDDHSSEVYHSTVPSPIIPPFAPILRTPSSPSSSSHHSTEVGDSDWEVESVPCSESTIDSNSSWEVWERD